MSARRGRARPVPLPRYAIRPARATARPSGRVRVAPTGLFHAIPIVCIALLAASAHAAELHIGNGGEPLTLDPHRYNLNLEEKILADLFEG